MSQLNMEDAQRAARHEAPAVADPAGHTQPSEDAPLHPVVQEEVELLARVRRTLLENPEAPPASEADIVRQLIELRDHMRAAKAEDKASYSQQMTLLTNQLDQLRAGRKTESVDPDAPYFGHLRLGEAGRVRDICLGKATRLEKGLRIVDWRNAPISQLFYRYAEGDEYAEEMNGNLREGKVLARRSVHIGHGELMRVGTPDGSHVRMGDRWTFLPPGRTRLAGGQGSALRAGRALDSRLGAGVRLRADKHLPDIAALIDPEQFELITASHSGVVVLRGSAGSGKTTVALHRIAWLTFDRPGRFQPKRILVMVWGRAMRDYVAHVLPALGVEGVQVATWSTWARSMVRRHYAMLPNTVADDTPAPVTRLKVHPGVAEALARRIARTNRPRKPEQAIDDWARLLTDRKALEQAVGDDLGPAALDRAMAWTSEQTRDVLAFVEGESDVDARLDPEDDALLLRAFQLRCGPLAKGRGRSLSYAHIVLDEVQDFSPVEVQVLLETADKHKCVTLAGDTRQHISEDAGFSSWTGFLDRIGVESTALSTLEVSYRSTHPITRFAIEVLDDHEEPPPRTMRDGPPVELFPFSDHGACVAFLAEELDRLLQNEPLANVALLTPDAHLSRMYFDGLQSADVHGVRLVVNQKFAFAPGIDVVEASQVKGLEFDYVIIVEAAARYYPDTPHHRRLLHVAATRAVHQLWITTVGSPSTILPQVKP